MTLPAGEQLELIFSYVGYVSVRKELLLEGSSGFFVWGGGADQNLVILDDAIVYNASHLFGFPSADYPAVLVYTGRLFVELLRPDKPAFHLNYVA